MWPYEPRDPATHNIFQPYRAAGSHWRPDYHERLASYGYEYAYAVVVGFNLPKGVRWSEQRRQYVAREPADTRHGGGIFLHVQRSRHTAGCVAGPIDDIRAVVRWLDPARHRDGVDRLREAPLLTPHGKPVLPMGRLPWGAPDFLHTVVIYGASSGRRACARAGAVRGPACGAGTGGRRTPR